MWIYSVHPTVAKSATNVFFFYDKLGLATMTSVAVQSRFVARRKNTRIAFNKTTDASNQLN